MQLLGINTVIFDFDGTLATCPLDFRQMRQCVLEAAHLHGINPAALGEMGLLETIDAGVELLGEDQLQSAAFREVAMHRLSTLEYEAAALTELLPGIVEGLERLRRAGYRLGIVTRNSAAAVARIIGDSPLPFDALLCREDVRRPKPHPEHVEEMLHLLGASPTLAVMVGDHPMDIEMGHAAGMRTVAVLTGQSSAGELRAAHPDLLLPSVRELIAGLIGPGDAAHHPV
jgi:phosphoglycolate phosphatase